MGPPWLAGRKIVKIKVPRRLESAIVAVNTVNTSFKSIM